MTPLIKVLLADDHRIVRAGLRVLLQGESDMMVVGEVSTGRSAVEMVKGFSPDVVVMDIRMPDLNGVDATRQAIALRRDLKVIGLSANTDERSTLEMLRAGAVGYVAKESAYEELTKAIRAVVAGRLYFSPAIAARLAGGDGSAESAGRTSFIALSQREREVLQLIAEGKATKEVAAHLHISTKTAETHRRNLMEKLQIDSVAGLTRYAIREGLTVA